MNAGFMEEFCRILSCSLELPSYTYTCLLITGGESGVSSAGGCAQYVYRLTPRIPQPYM